MQDNYSEQISKATKGRADTYEINSVEQDANGRYVANVAIFKTTTTKKYQAPGLSADNRRSITVFDSTSDPAKRGIGSALQQKIIYRISGDILNAIYPLKVASVENNEVVFSQSLNQGDVYECFALGKAIKDAYTKENTGRVESKTANIEITRTSLKLSYAKITEGNVKVGDIYRPLSDTGSGNGYTIGCGANYQIQEGGGVNLGF